MKISDKIIIKDYQSGLSAKAIARKYNVSDTGIKYRLIKNNITIRHTSYIWKKFNEYFFDIIDTPEKAYWLGFLYADGYNNQPVNKVVFALHIKDRCILEIFKKHIEFEGRILLNKHGDKRYKNKTVMASIGLTSKHFSENLAKKGCFQKKSLKTRMPDNTIVPEKFMWHFIRGIFDGDGSIYGETNATFSICGGGEFIDELCEFLDNFNIKTHKYKQKRAKYCNISNIIDVIAFGNLIYENSENCRLKRKYDKFLKFKQYLLNKYNLFKQLMINIGLENGEKNLNLVNKNNFTQIFTFGSKVAGYNKKQKIEQKNETFLQKEFDKQEKEV